MEDNINNVGAYDKKMNSTTYAVAESLNDVSGMFTDKNITYNGSLQNLNIDTILRDKQGHINDIYQLADYYVDAEELVGSAVKKIFVPFSISDGWSLTGGNDKTRAKYYEWFERIHFDEKIESWFYQYYLFANVYFALMEDSDIVTLPPHLCRITNVLVNGNPLVEYNVKSVKQDFKKQTGKALKKYLEDEDLKVRVAGLPKEVSEALNKNVEWVQLDPKTTFIFQGYKPEWLRYAMPMIVQCLKPLAKKEIISAFESQLLTLAAAGFLHVTVGAPPDGQVVADNNILSGIQALVKKAMAAGGGIFTSNDLVKTEFIQVDVDHMWDKSKYEDVNNEILGALGISSSVTSGNDASISYGSSQVSTRLVSLRISAARKAFCALMNRIIRAVNGSPYGLPRTTSEKLPTFVMPHSDLTKVAAFQEQCMKLWESGSISRKTMLTAHGVDIDMEKKKKKKEQDDGYDDVFVKPGTNNSSGENNTEQSEGDGKRGRPTMDDDERNSDPSKSDTGRQEKPSRPDGSEPQEE